MNRGSGMMKRLVLIGALAFAMPHIARSGTLEDSFEKLPDEERARQACILKGIDLIRKEKRLVHADRIKTSIFNGATFDGKLVVSKGGAVRSDSRWYHLQFTCAVTPDLKHATSFTYAIGDEIPEAKWEDLGLWK